MSAEPKICVLFCFYGVLVEPFLETKPDIDNTTSPHFTPNVLAHDTIKLFKKAGIHVAVVVTQHADYYHAVTSWIRSYFGSQVTVYYQNSDTEKTPITTKRRAYENAKKKYAKVFFVDAVYEDLSMLSAENFGCEEYFILMDSPNNQASWTPFLKRIGNHVENDQGWVDMINHIIVEEK